MSALGISPKEKRTHNNILSESVSREVREISMRFGWCMACEKKERSVNAFEEIYGRGLAWLSVVIVAGLIGGLISPESKAEVLGGLDQRLNPDLLAQVFPGAQSFGAVGGKPAAAPVFQEGDLDGLPLLAMFFRLVIS